MKTPRPSPKNESGIPTLVPAIATATISPMGKHTSTPLHFSRISVWDRLSLRLRAYRRRLAAAALFRRRN